MAADDLLQQYARDFNCLADPDRKTRQRALQKLGALARSPPPELDGVWEQALRAPLLKLFSDTVEKNRELSITLVTDLVPSLGAAALGGSLPYMVPVFVARLASKPVAEDGEELRLALLQLLQLLLQRAGGEPMAPHLPELVQVLVAGFADPFPDAKKAACALAQALAEQLPTYIEPHCAALVKALQPTMAHQHSRVRSVAVEALVALLLREPSPLPEIAPQLALIASDRAPAVREQAVHSVTQLLARMPQREQHGARLLPLLLCALSDEVASIASHALASLDRLGGLLATAAAPGGGEAGGASAGDGGGGGGGPVPMEVDLVAAAAAAASGHAAGSQAATAASEAAAAASEAAAAAAAAGSQPVAPEALRGSPFAAAPPVGAAALCAAEMHAMLPPLLKEVSDWTVKGRLRAASTLLGLLWMCGPASTAHLETILPSLLRCVEDEDEEVRKQVKCCVAVVGASCEVGVYLPIVLRQLMVPRADDDAAGGGGGGAAGGRGVGPAGGGVFDMVGHNNLGRNPAKELGGEHDSTITRRGLSLSLLDALIGGASADALRPHLPSLLSAVAQPAFCVPPSQADGYNDDAHAAAYAGTQLRLCALMHTLVGRAGALVAQPPQGYSAYCALMRLASVPSSAARGFASQQRAMEALAALAAAAGGGAGGAGGGTEALHAEHLPTLLSELVADRPRYEAWDVASSEWHLLQALLRQCDGATAAAQLITFVLPLTALLQPKQEPPLRLTALGVLDHLLATPSFVAAAELSEWAQHLLAAMLLPNLVWRAGRAAEQVRLAAMLCLSRLLGLPRDDLVTAEQLAEQTEGALPVLISSLDDDNVETRGLTCAVLTHVLRRLGPAKLLTSENVRALYPELLKRLDDASDDVRMRVCEPLLALIAALRYSSTHADGANFDRTNFQYLLRGLLVHLDDANPDIQQATYGVLDAAAVAVDVVVFTEEVKAVRERHRSTRLCDALIEKAQAAGQLV